MDAKDAASRAAEAVVRDSHGRLVAYLATRTRDLDTAEDALADALSAALETWPRDGVPDRPEAWLLAVARRKLIDDARHEQVKADSLPTLRLAAEHRQDALGSGAGDDSFPDDRLKLLFVCAHPAIDPAARTPLMLQVVLGLDAARIASAFLVAPATMGQRLVRAKAKIRDAGVRFEVPDSLELPARLGPVLDAVYAAHGTGWEDAAGVDPRRRGLAGEAIDLARILVSLLPEEPEAWGLLSLLLHCEARREARRSSAGEYIPLDRQDFGLWSRSMIDEAERCLARASTFGAIGRFQLEAAIQSAHAQRAVTGKSEWEAIVLFHDELVRRAPTVGALVSRAAALVNVHGPDAALSALEDIDPSLVLTYQPYWAVRAHVLAQLGDAPASQAAYSQAIGLSEDPSVRTFLIQGRDRLRQQISRPAGS